MEAPVANALSAIGWNHLLKGRLAIQWREIMDQHLSGENHKKSGARWAVDIVDCLLQQWWQQAIREMQQLYKLKDNVLPQH